MMTRGSKAAIFLVIALFLVKGLQEADCHSGHPLSKISVHKAISAVDKNAYIKASPSILGVKGQTAEWVRLEFVSPKPSSDDWIGVFSPANFSAATCAPLPGQGSRVSPPFLCSAPIKFQYANYSTPCYKSSGKGSLTFQIINQRSDFSFALFTGGLSSPKLVAVSNKVAFANPNAPVYPRLAQGKIWNEMTVTWTSGYGINEAEPFVEWGRKEGGGFRSPAGTLTFNRNSMCGAPARTVGWRDPGYIHTSFLKELCDMIPSPKSPQGQGTTVEVNSARPHTRSQGPSSEDAADALMSLIVRTLYGDQQHTKDEDIAEPSKTAWKVCIHANEATRAPAGRGLRTRGNGGPGGKDARAQALHEDGRTTHAARMEEGRDQHSARVAIGTARVEDQQVTSTSNPVHNHGVPSTQDIYSVLATQDNFPVSSTQVTPHHNSTE